MKVGTYLKSHNKDVNNLNTRKDSVNMNQLIYLNECKYLFKYLYFYDIFINRYVN